MQNGLASAKPEGGGLPGRKRAFQNALTRWFEAEGKDYPWRRTHDPYAVLVSELMLQQTQVATVIGKRYFERWLKRFPTVRSLAGASEDAILKQWEGLGYYRRARNLQKAAQVILEEHGGIFPEELANIEALPGVGRYTAGAVASFAFGQSAPLVDSNVARVFARLFDCDQEVDSPAGLAQLWSWAEELVPKRSAREYNSALMELGQRVCTTREPLCAECPVSAFCSTRRPETLPKKKPRTQTLLVDEFAIYAERRGEVLLEREEGKRREGLWKLPQRSAEEVADLPILLKSKYSITHHRVTLEVHEGGIVRPRKNESWFAKADVEQVAMPSPYRKALEAIMTNLDFRLE